MKSCIIRPNYHFGLCHNGAVNFEQYLRGYRREFFEAHEALEDVWRATLGPDRKSLQEADSGRGGASPSWPLNRELMVGAERLEQEAAEGRSGTL